MPLPMRQARMHPPMAPMGPMHHWISRRLPTDRGIRCISVVRYLGGMTATTADSRLCTLPRRYLHR